MKKRLGMTAAMALAAATLSACGSSTDDYCDSLKDAKAEFESFDNGDFAEFDNAIDRMKEIGESAPDEVSDDWEVMLGTIDEMEQALEDAGLSFEDLGGLANGEIPEGVDEADLTGLQETFSTLESEDVDKASENIDVHAEEECGVTLS